MSYLINTDITCVGMMSESVAIEVRRTGPPSRKWVMCCAPPPQASHLTRYPRNSHICVYKLDRDIKPRLVTHLNLSATHC